MTIDNASMSAGFFAGHSDMKLARFDTLDLSVMTIGGIAHDSDSGLYDALLEPPVTFVTNTVRALSGVEADVLFVEVQGNLLNFVSNVESTLKNLTCAKQDDLFPGKNISEEAIRARFKSYLTSSNVLRLKLKKGAPVFDVDGEKVGVDQITRDTRLRAVLTLCKLSIGKTEFGVVWEAEQVRIKENPQEEDEPDVPAPASPPRDLQEVCVIDDNCSEVGDPTYGAVISQPLPEVRVIDTGASTPPKTTRQRKKRTTVGNGDASPALHASDPLGADDTAREANKQEGPTEFE